MHDSLKKETIKESKDEKESRGTKEDREDDIHKICTNKEKLALSIIADKQKRLDQYEMKKKRLEKEIKEEKRYLAKSKEPLKVKKDKEKIDEMYNELNDKGGKAKCWIIHLKTTFKSKSPDVLKYLKQKFTWHPVEVEYWFRSENIINLSYPNVDGWEAMQLDDIILQGEEANDDDMDRMYFEPVYNDGDAPSSDDEIEERGYNGDHKAMRMQGRGYQKAYLLYRKEAGDDEEVDDTSNVNEKVQETKVDATIE